MALGQEITAQTVCDLGSIDAIVLPLGCSDGPKHQRDAELQAGNLLSDELDE